MGDNSLLAEFEAAEERSEGAGKQQAHRPAVLADGSYATQTALADTTSITTNGTAAVPNIRSTSSSCFQSLISTGLVPYSVAPETGSGESNELLFSRDLLLDLISAS